MTQTVEIDLGKILERIEQNQIEIKVGLTRLEGEVQNIKATLSGKIDTLQVEVLNTKEDVKEIKAELKEVKTELKETKNDVSGLYKWVIGTLVVAAVGAANIFLKFFDLLPKA